MLDRDNGFDIMQLRLLDNGPEQGYCLEALQRGSHCTARQKTAIHWDTVVFA